MLTNINTLRWADATHTIIDLLGTHKTYGEIPFSASKNDIDEQGRALFNRAFAGEFGPIAEYVEPLKTTAQKIADIDRLRDAVINSGLTFGGNLYHADAMFQSQLQAFILAWSAGLLAPAATVSVRRKDNVTVQMGQAEIVALAGALMQFVQGVYSQSWADKDALLP